MLRGGWAVLLALSGAASLPAVERPNVIVILSDDQGWPDLAASGVRPDVITPHADALARDGVRFTRGYVTAPQCLPSRVGLLTGRYQQRCGVENNVDGPLPLGQATIATRFAAAGYATGMVGKWDSDVRVSPQVERLATHSARHFGFREIFQGELGHYRATHDLSGRPVAGGMTMIRDDRYRVDVQTEAALAFIDRHADGPFLLYVSYYAPHVPTEAPAAYLERFADVTDPMRRAGLAMIASVDDGIGRIRARLAQRGIDRRTLIVFLADNGAPTKENAWNGSLNEPFLGEKGMVTDGGVRVPFLVCWPDGLPAGRVYDHPVSSLDVLPTALAAAGEPAVPAGATGEAALDGVDLLPYLRGTRGDAPHEFLFWRFRSQAAILAGPWKLIFTASGTTRLFDVTTPGGERGEHDLAATHPETVAHLMRRLTAWTETLQTPGLPTASHWEDERFFADHIDPATRRALPVTTRPPLPDTRPAGS